MLVRFGRPVRASSFQNRRWNVAVNWIGTAGPFAGPRFASFLARHVAPIRNHPWRLSSTSSDPTDMMQLDCKERLPDDAPFNRRRNHEYHQPHGSIRFRARSRDGELHRARPRYAGGAAGASPRIDAIRKAGVLRVGVLANVPWLVENTTGSGPQWGGPAWLLASEYAKLLGVEVEPVAVSNETRIPVLASNQVDMTITALAQTEERLKVVDFVIYSQTSVCMFGRADNPAFAAITS